MKKPFLSFLYSCFASLALVSAAVAENSATFTLYTPRYCKDTLLVSANPSFILGQRGSFTSFESFPSSATYAVDASALSQAHPGYYVSKWELSTAWGAGMGGTAIQTQSGGTSFTVSFDYKWAAKYGTQLDLTVYLSQMSYSVGYDANGGAWTGSEPEAGPWKYSAGGTVPGAQDVSRAGYALTGWARSSGKTIEPGASFTGASLGVTSDGQEVALTAQWSAQPYTATVAAGDGGSGGCTVDYSYSESQSQTKTITLPTREGHAISTWTATGYSGSAPTIQGTTLTIPAKTSGDFTMTPTWKADACSLRVVKGTGIAQIVCDFTRDGKACHETTSYDATYSADFGTAWSAYAVAAEGYSTDASASGTMTAAGAVFSPTASPNDYLLRLTPGTGISNIWYRVGASSEWIWTTNSIVVPVPFNATWQAYAEPAEGYAYTATSLERPASGTMTAAGASFEPVGTVQSYALRLEVTPGIAKICYKVGAQKYYDETTTSSSVPVEYGTAWSAYALAVEGCSTNETCAASGTMGAGGAVFRPRVNAKPYSLTLTPGTGIASIFYKTNETQAAWCRVDRAAAVPVLFGDTWSAYAVAADGYTYAKTSAELPKTGVMTTEGAAFAPSGVANSIWVRYDRNGGGDAGRMDDSEFTYDVESPLRLNAYARSYEIHYNGNGGTCAHENDISGYAFAGWRDTPDGQEGAGHYSYTDGQRVTNPCGSKGAAANDPVLLYAQWKPKSVTLPLPVRAGYDFSGWYTLSSGGQRVGGAGEAYMATDDITLYAHWRTHVTKLSFVVGDEEVADYAHAVANGLKFEDFGSLPELTNTATKVFLGWYTAPEGGTRITDTTTVDLTGDAVTLYAQWETVTYTIAYEPNGGTVNGYAKPGYSPGQAFALPTDVTRTGRTFLGWYDNPTFEGEPIAGITSGMTGDKTFYARWSTVAGETVTLTFVNVSGYSFDEKTSCWQTLEDTSTPRLSETYAKGDKVTLPGALFSQEGIRQVGWRQAGDTKANPNTWDKFELGYGLGVVTQDRTFHSIWRTNTYTVVYDGNGGTYAVLGKDKGKTEIEQGPWMYGTEVTVSSTSTSVWERTGYTCIGWANTKEGHVVYAGGEAVTNLTAVDKGVVTLYAVWEEKKVAEVSPVPPAPKLTAVRTPLSIPQLLNFSTSQPSQHSYTLHFSPGASVVNPQAMTNRTVSGSVTLPDCLYTNVEGATFAGWTCNGKPAGSPFAPEIAFDGQIVTVTAAWKPLECGDLSDAVGLTNAVLTCADGTWQVSEDEGREGKTCLKVEVEQESSDLTMRVTGPGELTYWWKTDDIERPISNVVDGVSTAIVVSDTNWVEKTLSISNVGEHTITWYSPKCDQGYATFWLDDVRWEPEQPTYALTAAANPEAAGSASVNGASFVVGAKATLTATANPDWLFAQWNDGSTEAEHTVTVWGDITNYVAEFAHGSSQLNVSAEPSEGGTVTGAGTYEYMAEAELVATANAGWSFGGWSDGATENPHTVTVVCTTNLTATFQRNNYPLTLTVGEGVAKVWYVIGGAAAQSTTSTLVTNVAFGTSYKVWAEAKYGYQLTGPGSSAATAVTGTMGVGGSAFSPAPSKRSYNVTATADPSEGGSVTGAGAYAYMAEAELVATANAGWSFGGWSDGATENPHTVTVVCTTNLTATFQRNNYPLTLTVGEGVAKIWYEIGSAAAQSTTDSLVTNIAFGTSYKLWAEAKSGYQPQGQGWSREDAIDGTMGTAGFEFKPDSTKRTYAVGATAEPADGGSVTGAGTYEYMAEAELVATANAGWSFGGWSDGSTENPHTVTVICTTNLTATFQRNNYPLTLTVGEGVAKVWYVIGGAAAQSTTSTLVTNVAFGTSYKVWAEAKYGYQLTGPGSSAATAVTGTMGVGGSAFSPAPSKRSYNVTAAADPSEGGSVTGAGTYEYMAEAELSATANAGWSFGGWSDGATENPHTVTVICATNLTAAFQRNEYPLTLTVGEGVAKVWYVIGGAAAQSTTSTLVTNVAFGTSYKVWAEAKYGYQLTGPGSSEATAVTGTMGVGGSAFSPAPSKRSYNVTAVAEPSEGGTVTGAGTYEYMAEAELVAAANAGWSFGGWSEGSTEITNKITVVCATNLTATFSKIVETNYYYVAFDGNGATAGAMGEQTNVCGAAALLCSNAFVRTGYTFNGWVSIAGKTVGKTYEDGATVTDDLALTNRAALLKAIWTPVEYRIDFDPGAGRGTMDSLHGCHYDVSYQLPDCTFERDKVTFSGWATNEAGAVVYTDGAIVRNLAATGGIITLYAVWGGHGQAFVNITGHTATKYYTGRPFTVLGYDVDIPSEGYYEKDFTTVPGTVTSLTETDVGTYSMNLSSDSFTNLVPSVSVLFEVKGDGWLKILSSQIGGEPGDREVAAGGLSRFDATGTYGDMFDGSVLSNEFAEAYGPCDVEYAALESGPWSANAPVFASVGTTSFWYRVAAVNGNLKPFVHEVAVEVEPRGITDATTDPIADQKWTGKPLKPEATVTWLNGMNVVTLAEGTDYYLTYQNNTDPGVATATVHGMGNWTGTTDANFGIVKEITDEPGPGVVPIGGLSKFDVTAAYDGTAHTVDATALTNAYAASCAGVRVTFGATKAGPWTAIPTALTDAGTTSFWYRVEADYCKPYVHEVQVTVTPRDLAKVTVAPIPEQAWTGSAITPPVTVTDGEPSIVTAADYDVAYSDNVAPGTATATLTGKRNYTGTKTANFTIRRDLSPVRVTITGRTATAAYDGRAHTASGYDFVSTDAAYTAADFTCRGTTSVSQTDVGTARANLTGADFENRNSGFDVEFVVAQDISVTVTTGTISGEPGSGTVPAGGLSKFDTTCVYDGQPHSLDVAALTKAFGEAYGAVSDIAYAMAGTGPWSASPIAITDAGTTSFWYRVQVRNFTSFVHEAKVTVVPRDIVNATVAPIPDQIATGEPIEPDVTVTDGKPSIITDEDYDVSYSDNVAVGTATVTLTGKRNYCGVREEPFKIISKPGYYVCAYGEQVSVNLQADFPDKTIKSVSGLPSGLKYKNGYVTGKSTKAVEEKAVKVTFQDGTKTTMYWTVKPGENHGVTVDFGAEATGETSAEAAVGTAVEWTVTAAEEGAKVTMSKLPTGLKYSSKTGLITGTPTKAKEYAMTVKTVVNGLTVTQTFYIMVEALPTMMVGTYYGAAKVGGIAGQFQLKLAATGKATGSFYAAGKKISLKLTAITKVDEDCYAVTVSYTYNRQKYTDEIVLSYAATVEGVKGDDVDIWSAAVSGSEALEEIDARRDVIKEAFGKVVSKTKSYDINDESFEEGEYLTATVTAAGKVTVKGKLLSEADNPTTVSGSTNLIVDDNGKAYCWITIYKAVSRQEPIVYEKRWYLPDDED